MNSFISNNSSTTSPFHHSFTNHHSNHQHPRNYGSCSHISQATNNTKVTANFKLLFEKLVNGIPFNLISQELKCFLCDDKKLLHACLNCVFIGCSPHLRQHVCRNSETTSNSTHQKEIDDETNNNSVKNSLNSKPVKEKHCLFIELNFGHIYWER